jgi:hypothetical protein
MRLFVDVKMLKKINWNALMAIATIVYALFTILMWYNMNRQVEQSGDAFKETQKSIRLQDSSFNLQKDFYQRTIRPFVFVDSLGLHDVPSRNCVLIEYGQKNVGHIPCRELKGMAWLDSIPHKIIYNEVSWIGSTFAQIFPNERRTATAIERYVHLDEIWKKPFVHIVLTYKDPGGKEYQYYRIFKMQKVFRNNKLCIDYLNIWDYFN